MLVDRLFLLLLQPLLGMILVIHLLYMTTTETEFDNYQIAQSVTELWTPLTEDQRRLLAESITVCRYQKNDIIYQEGDTPECLFCLIEGKVKIYKEGIGGRQQIVRMAKPHGFFGYRAGFVDDQYSTSASAFESSTLCHIPLPVLKSIISENSDVAIYFIKLLASLLGSADEQTVSLTQKHIRGRLADALLRLRDKYGVAGDGHTLDISLSREDLANLSNMTTSNAIRTLSAFASEGLIALDGRNISLLNEERLQHISEMG